MAIIKGAHVLLYTSEPDACREIFRDVFDWDHVDAGGGWLIFALPPAELAVHPTDGAASHELTFLCDDLGAATEALRAKGIEIKGEPHEERWGVVTTIVLPGGVDVMLYEPRHETAI